VAATAGVPNAEQGLAASLFQTSFQVGGAVVLAIVTAVVEAGGAGQISSASATLAAYRPALGVITGIAAIGMLVALSGLRSRQIQPDPAGDLAARELDASGLRAGAMAGDLASGGLTDEVAPADLSRGESVGGPALQRSADVAGGGTTT
jgi:hypothetical protein